MIRRILRRGQPLALFAAVLLLVACDKGPLGEAGDEPDARPNEPVNPRIADEPPAEPKTMPVGPPAPVLPAIAGIEYLEIITGDAEPDAALPMIIAIHGLGDTPFGFRGLVDGLATPARIILPRAIHAHEVGYAWFRRRARDPDVRALAHGIGKAADRLAPAILELQKQRPTVGKPILTGFSQGGMLTFTLWMRHPELFSAAIAVGGWLPPPLWPTAAASADLPPLASLHGTKDPAVRYEPTRAAIEHLKKLGYPVELVSYEGVRHAIPPQMRDELRRRLEDALATAAPGEPDPDRELDRP